MATGSSPPAGPQTFKVFFSFSVFSTATLHPSSACRDSRLVFGALQLILGSSSVARKHILEEMGLEFEVMTADIDEKSIRRENPDELVMVLAEAKADAIMSRLNIADYQKEGDQPTLLITSDIVCFDNLCSHTWCNLILSCYESVSSSSMFHVYDSNQHFMIKTLEQNETFVVRFEVVVHEGIIREKPTTKEEARQFLKGYSGGHVSTVGSVVVTNLTTGKRTGSLDKAEVYFHDIPDEIIENLIDEGVVFRVAGGLLLEHPLTLPFVEAVVGSSDSVMGLSKEIANRLIHDAVSRT
ncbi:hypothetical protein EJB05_27233 [Eragrostis curvula]|uniref:Maf-like protein n=1 Tax=Eragrostis curvula TaxID=38414 RepID=A0A5J9UMI2_9POAL|nr:hypothetical protein EJB05_27233 [Eragrostis curvula]